MGSGASRYSASKKPRAQTAKGDSQFDRPAQAKIATEAELHAILLSAAARSDAEWRAVDLDEEAIPVMQDQEIMALFSRLVPGVEHMLDRLGDYPVCHYVCLTYEHGLPAQASSPKLQDYTRAALRYIIYSASDNGQHRDCGAKTLRTVAEAYQSCQQVQARTIDTLFGALSGRTQGLRDQLLTLVDAVKQQTLDKVTLQLHPFCLSQQADMEEQMPHIQSAYVSACGLQLGLRGVAASHADRMKPNLSRSQIQVFVKEYSCSFSVEEVVQALVRDVNQVGEGADRVIDLHSLFSWCDQAAEEQGFCKASIFYQEDRPELYSASGVPAAGSLAERLQAPWLHPQLVQEILHLCLGPQRCEPYGLAQHF